MKYTINVVTRLQDNQDGGYTLYAYNNMDEMLADHPRLEDCDGMTEEEIEEIKQNILGGDDEYENGYISREIIEIDVTKKCAKLAAPLSIGCGQ